MDKERVNLCCVILDISTEMKERVKCICEVYINHHFIKSTNCGIQNS